MPDAATGARAVPIYQSTSFVFADTTDAASLFALQKYGKIYSRIANPTVAALEERLASLEGGIGAVATASGQAAEFLTFACLAGAGDHIVAAAGLYGGTITQLDVTLRRFGVDTTFVAGGDPADVRRRDHPADQAAVRRGDRQPGRRDRRHRRAGRRRARAPGSRWSSTPRSATPYLCRPIEHGADIVIHSATKFLGGHGTTLGGVVVESGRFDWGNGRFPQMTEPVPSYGGLNWWGNFQEFGFLTKLRAEQLRDIGAIAVARTARSCCSRAWRRCRSGWRRTSPNARASPSGWPPTRGCRYVRWAGLPDHPHHERARRYLPLGPGAVFSFGVRGGREAGRRFIEAVQLCSHLANVGDARTLVIHPGSTTHQQLTDEQLAAAGVPPDLVRISVGLEDVEDILWDLDQALAAATKGA